MQIEDRTAHEDELRHRSIQARQGHHGLRPLQCQERTFRHADDLTALANVRCQVALVSLFAAGVDDQKELTETRAGRGPNHHQIVQQTAARVGEEGVALAAFGQAQHVHRNQAFQCGGAVVTDQPQLAHVRNVKQRCGGAALFVLGHQTSGVLHGHGITRKGHHLGAQAQVQVVQGRVLQSAVGQGGHGGSGEGN